MKIEKDLPDSEILKNVITALRVKAGAFQAALKYKSKSTMYMVLRGQNSLSDDFINRIVLAYPNVSYLYLTRGKGTPLNTGASATNQNNLLNTGAPAADMSLKDVLSIPDKLDRIEANQQLIISLLEKVINKP